MIRPPDRTRPPEPAAATAFRPPPFVRRRADDGLGLVLAPRAGAPLVEVLLLLPAGGSRNPLDRSGLAALTAALVDEGTRQRSGLELATELERLGTTLVAGADWDAARLAVSGLAENLDTALAALAEVARQPSFPAAEVERLRAQTLAEIARRRDHAGRLADRELAATLFAGTPYAELLQGGAEHVAAISRDEIAAFHERHYRPAGGHLVLGGAFDPERAEELVRRHFGDWSGRTAAPPEALPAARSGVTVRIVDLPRAAQTELRVGHAGVPRTHPDRTRLGVVNALLGGKFTSRLNLNLRERHGFTYGVASRFVDRRAAGPFVVATAVANDVAGAAVAEILAELRRIVDEPVGASELAETRSYLVGVFPYTFQTIAGQVARLADLALHDLPDDHFERALAEISALGVDDVQRLAAAHLRPQACTIVAVGPAAELRRQLGGFGTVEVVTLA